MPRIQPITSDTATAESNQILDAVQAKLGMIPNLISTLAQSPAAANAYLGMSQALGSGGLSPRLREQIALTVGQANRCDYCVSAHAMLGRQAGLQDRDVEAARKGNSFEPKEQSALNFASSLVENRGRISDSELESVRENGWTESEIVEIVANVALNLFTNYFNHVAETEIDFPLAPALAG